MIMEWIENNPYYLKSTVTQNFSIGDKVKIAAFDLDDTLICYKRGQNFKSKWQIIDNVIIDKINDLINRKYIIVIITNQLDFFKKNTNIWKSNADTLINSLIGDATSYYVSIYVAANYDMYRKPNIKLWSVMLNDLADHFRKKIIISSKTFFCGDAAGRDYRGYFKQFCHQNTKKDFSDVDIKFALNIHINFFTPEKFFMDINDTPKLLKGVNPYELLKSTPEFKYNFGPRNKELIILVGPPAAGKSYFVKKYLSSYAHINQDTCGSITRCRNLANKYMEAGKSIVVDNTNPDVDTRNIYISIARLYDYEHIRCIVFDVDIAIANHLNNVRHILSNGTIKKIPKLVYSIYKNKYVEPNYNEGFDKIEHIPFYIDGEFIKNKEWLSAFKLFTE